MLRSGGDRDAIRSLIANAVLARRGPHACLRSLDGRISLVLFAADGQPLSQATPGVDLHTNCYGTQSDLNLQSYP